MAYRYDHRVTKVASRVTFTAFGRIDGDGGRPATILLDGVRVGEISRNVEMLSKGVMQKIYTVQSYTASLQGPLLNLAGSDAVDSRDYTNLPELKKAATALLNKVPAQVAEVYALYWSKKISSREWGDRVHDLLSR